MDYKECRFCRFNYVNFCAKGMETIIIDGCGKCGWAVNKKWHEEGIPCKFYEPIPDPSGS